MQPRFVANLLSFVRIPLAVILIMCFQADLLLLSIALLALILAYLSDLADGYVARKFSVASTEGQLWDSLADKAIYIGAIVAMNNKGILDAVIAWAIILRDVGMYVSRIVYVHRLDRLAELKIYSYAHCFLIYTTILLGFAEMYELTMYGAFGNLLFVNVAATVTFIVGAYGSLKFVVMK